MTAPVSAPEAGEDRPPTPGVAVQPLDASHDVEAAALLAGCATVGRSSAGRDVLAAARNDPESAISGAVLGGTLIAVCLTRKVPMAVEVTHLAVAEDHRRRGHGRACLQDALRRAGKRPLVAESDEATLPFFRACGFKPVGRRTRPDGTVRYRLGWHAPPAHPPARLAGPRPGPGTGDDR